MRQLSLPLTLHIQADRKQPERIENDIQHNSITNYHEKARFEPKASVIINLIAPMQCLINSRPASERTERRMAIQAGTPQQLVSRHRARSSTHRLAEQQNHRKQFNDQYNVTPQVVAEYAPESFYWPSSPFARFDGGSDNFARAVFIATGDVDSSFSDNYFDILPGGSVKVEVYTDLPQDRFEKQLKVVSLSDEY